LCHRVIERFTAIYSIAIRLCGNVKENASKAVEFGGQAYNAYQDIRGQPIK
jgi:hypothetical protein